MAPLNYYEPEPVYVERAPVYIESAPVVEVVRPPVVTTTPARRLKCEEIREYRTLVNVWGGASHVLARLRSRSTHTATQVHPADLDDALCASAVVASSSGNETRLPFAVDDALLQGTLGKLWAVRSIAL